MARPSTSPIRFDETPFGIVVYCTDHEWWRAFRFHHDDAYTAACRHEADEHAGDYRRRKHADRVIDAG